MPLDALNRRAEAAARWMVVATAFVVPLPTAWVTLTTLLFLGLWLCAGQFVQRWQVIRQHPLAMLSAALLVWMAVAMLWSPADWRPSLDQWWHYRELLLLPLMLSVVGKDTTTAATWQPRILNAFVWGFGVALVVSFLRWQGLVEEGVGGKYAGFGGHTGFSVMLAFVAYVAWVRAQPRTPQRLWWALLGLVCVGNLFLINTGRTGQVGFLALLPLAVASRLGWKKVWIGLLAVPALALAAYMASPVVHERVNQTVADVQGFQAGNAESNDGLRMDFWRHAVGFIQQAPMVGGGTGSYIYHYRQAAVAEGLTGNRVSDNPHNEYLLIAAQQGVVGLALLLALWGVQWWGAGRLPAAYADLTRALLLLMASGDLFNSFILDNLEGHFYMVMTVALCAAWPHRQPQTA